MYRFWRIAASLKSANSLGVNTNSAATVKRAKQAQEWLEG
jgi:hypothetical protein